MKNKVGLWIDHRKAVIVRITDVGEEIKQISSDIEKHVKYTGDLAEGGRGEDILDRQYQNHLNDFYDKVIAYLRGTDSILIFGPGEAKHQLGARLERDGLKQHVVVIQNTDKMTDRQIAAKVRKYFQDVER